MTAVLDVRSEATVTRARMIAELSDDERGDTLLAVARHHMNGHFTDDDIAGIVHQLAGPAVVTPLLRFEDLLQALREQEKFDNDPAGYLDTQERPHGPTSIDREAEQQAQEVGYCVWQLVRPTRSCSRCVQRSPQSAWQPSENGPYCQRHGSQP